MEHKPISDLSNLADLVPERPKVPLTRRERLARWIEVLDREPERALRTLREIEYKPRDARRASRVDNSPLSVAFNDPVLRADGLASDRLGDAIDYFELSDEDAHRAFCSCFYGESMTAGAVAGRLKGIMKPTTGAPLAIWGVGALLVAVPFLARLLQ
jgi:hypothetical protein